MASTSLQTVVAWEATPVSPDEFLVAMGRSIVQHNKLDGRVYVETRFDGYR